MNEAFTVPVRNITGIRFSIDTHIIDREDAQQLRSIYEAGWIQLLLPDTVMTEIDSRVDIGDREELLELSTRYIVNMGPIVLGSSLLGYSVNGSNDEQSRIREIHRILWDQSFDHDLSESGSSKGRTRARDSLIVNNSIKYHTDALITEDKMLRKKSCGLENYFPDFRAISIQDAVNEALRAISAIRAENIPNLPAWPSSGQINH